MSRAPRGLLKPILNISRFFVGDTIPRIKNADELHERAAALRKQKLKISKPAERLLSKTLELLLMAGGKKSKREQKQALGLLAGLLLEIVADTYFYVPETTEQASSERIKDLALQLEAGHRQRCRDGDMAVQVNGLQILDAASAAAMKARPLAQLDPELTSVLTKLEIHLSQGEQILAGQSDPARAQAHRERLQQAYQRATRLLGRLVSIPRDEDNARLRSRILIREQERIEIDALGAAKIDAQIQARETRDLLAQTEVGRGQQITADNAAEVAAQLQALATETDADSSGGDDDADWFFDMD